VALPSLPTKNVKSVHMKQYEIDGLEAIWADVMYGKIRVIIGSVYIPPNDFKALELLVLDSVIANITATHKHAITGMDANMQMLTAYCGTIHVLEYLNIVQV